MADEQQVILRNGNLYLSAQLYTAYFPGIQTVILLDKSPYIVIMPVHQAGAGGLLMKIRNAKGDRVVHALEFFRQLGLDGESESVLRVVWDSEYAALKFRYP